MFLMAVTVLLSLWKSAIFSTSGRPAWLFESVGKSPSPEDWGGNEHFLRGCQCCVPALRAHLGHPQLWLRSESDSSTSNGGLLFWVSRNCVQQMRGTPVQWAGLQGRNGCVEWNKAQGNLQLLLPYLQYRLYVKQQPQLTSALMSHLELHTLNGAAII